VIGVCLSTFAACDGDEPGGSTTSDCAPNAIWNRNVVAFDPSDDALPSNITDGVGDSPDAAVRDLASGIGLKIEVRRTRPADPSDPYADVNLDVTDGSGQTGTYQVAEKAGVWAVAGGNGCGAPPPKSISEATCPLPTPAPSARPGDEIQVTC
jgi:hypothetical protein